MSEAPPKESPDREVTTESIVEAIIFATDNPLPAPKIAQILGTGTARDVKKHVDTLNTRYEQQGCAFRIEHVADGFQMMTLPVYHRWLEQLSRTKSDSRLSQAALETLAVVAYKQPVLRADIEAIRGVSVGEVLNRLRELNLVKIVGRAEVIGRPMLYGTTKKFLQVFGLASLDDLPQVEALTPPERQRPAPADTTDEPDDPSPPAPTENEAGVSSDPGGET
jgi:segregation and condensation protein B